MSDLYKEALVDGRKLREIAEEEAKKQLLEKFTPFVKDMISKELKVKSSNLFESPIDSLKEKAFVVGEQEEDPTLDPTATDPLAAAPTDPLNATGAPATAGLPQDPAAAGLGVTPPTAPMSTDLDSAAPLEPTGQDLGNTTLDQLGDDGKITVDVNDLFSPGAPEAISQADEVMGGVDDAALASPDGVTPPAPADASGTTAPSGEEPIASTEEVPPAAPTEDETALGAVPPTVTEKVIAGINEVAYKIDILCLKEGKIKDLEKNYHKNRLFSLLEQVDNLKENGLISGRQAKVLENKLEFLFIKLKEANLANSYKKTITREDTQNMAKSLKSIAAQLFLEEADTIGKTQTAADNRSKSASKHAMDASGNPKGYDADSEDSVSTKETETFWDEQEPNGEGLLENYEAGDEVVDSSTGFGDEGSEEPEVEFEVSEAELMEAIKQLRKENVRRSNKAIKESMNLGEQAELGEEDAELDISSLDDAGSDDVEGLDVGGAGDDVASAERDLQAAFEALGITGVNVSLSSSSSSPAADSFGAGDDEEIEIVDDEDDLGSSEEGMLMHDDGEDELDEEMALYEAKLVARKKAALKESAKLVQMKRELNENNLFTAKTVFLNKILMKESMSKGTTRKVVELLDKARTLSEAKDIYQKILARLNEGKVAASSKLAGSSASRATRPGSTNLNEGVTRTPASADSSVDRWQILAGIKKSTQD